MQLTRPSGHEKKSLCLADGGSQRSYSGTLELESLAGDTALWGELPPADQRVFFTDKQPCMSLADKQQAVSVAPRPNKQVRR